MPSLCLYGTLGCHLCDVAEQLLAECVDLNRYPIELIDIADDDQLVEQYGVLIPVLADADSGQELHWPFTSEQVLKFIVALGSAR